MEVFQTVVSGVLVFVVGQMFLKMLIEPINKLKQTFATASHVYLVHILEIRLLSSERSKNIWGRAGRTHHKELANSSRQYLAIHCPRKSRQQWNARCRNSQLIRAMTELIQHRLLMFGMTRTGKCVVVSHTELASSIWIISARFMTKSERKIYEKR